MSLESHADRFRIGGQPEDLFDLMNYTDQESCQMENCEDSFDSGEKGGSSLAWGRDHFEADESIIGGDGRSGNGRDGLAMKRTVETNGQLTRLRHYKKKARYMGKQYRDKELPLRFDTSEPRLRIKSMHSKTDSRKSHRGVVPNHYFDGEFQRPNEMIDNAMVCSLSSRRAADNRIFFYLANNRCFST